MRRKDRRHLLTIKIFEESPQCWGIDCQKWKSTLDMVLNKQFSHDVDSKGFQNMGVKRRLLVIGMFGVCDFVYGTLIADLRLTTLMTVHDNNEYIPSRGTHRCD